MTRLTTFIISSYTSSSPKHLKHCNANKHLEAENLILQLTNRPRLVESQTLCRLLHGRNHRRRSANQNLDVLGGRWKLLLDHIGGNKTDASVPPFRRVVKHVVDAELGVLGGERIKFVFEQDILGVDVGKDEIDFGFVACWASAHNGLCDLQHGGDSGASGNHTKVSDHVGGVYHGALGASDLHLVANLEFGYVFGDVTGGVRLDDEVDMALVFVGGDGGIRADDFFGLAGDRGGERNVLADGEAEDISWTGQLEAVDGRVVRDDLLVLEFKLLELSGLEHFVGRWVGLV